MTIELSSWKASDCRRTVVSALKAHKKAMAKEVHHSPFCFVTKTGNHISKSNLTRQVLRPILKVARLPA